MIHSKPTQRSRLARIAGRLAILALPAALAVGCGGGSSGGGPPATATSVPAATSTATQPAATSTSTAPVTVTPPPATSTPAPPTPTPTSAPTADANAACAKLAGCDQCFINSTGQCITTDDCARRLAADAAICINAVTGCGATTLGDCLFPGCDGSDPSGECQ